MCLNLEVNKIAQDSTNGTARGTYTNKHSNNRWTINLLSFCFILADDNTQTKGNESPKVNGASQIQMSALFAAVPVLVAMKFF